MITVYLMTPEGPLPVQVNASSVKITDRGFLQFYDIRGNVVATFAAWAYWMDESAMRQEEKVLQ